MPVSLSALAPLRVIDHRLLEGTGAFTSEATTLFVDLVGFTPLTDQLGTFGSRGTEQLSEVLQGFFGSVTDQAMTHGGDPVAYGGDALTIVFDGDGPSTVAAARELAGSIHQLSAVTTGTETLAGRLSLQTRIGIARGAVTTTVVTPTIDRFLSSWGWVSIARLPPSPKRRWVRSCVTNLRCSAGTGAAVASTGKAVRGPSTRGGASIRSRWHDWCTQQSSDTCWPTAHSGRAIAPQRSHSSAFHLSIPTTSVTSSRRLLS